MADTNQLVCRHGSLRRSCETCDLYDQLLEVERERDELRELVDDVIFYGYEVPRHWIERARSLRTGGTNG